MIHVRAGVALTLALIGLMNISPGFGTTTEKPKHLRIVVIEQEPILFNITTTEGDVVLGGYMVDLLNKLQKQLNFTYETYTSPDGKWGTLGANGSISSWDGMMAELVSGRADMVAADMTITPMRSRDVAFTMPFTGAELGALYHRRQNTVGWSTFLLPFTVQVWSLVGAALLLTSAGLYLIAINDPEEHSLRSISCCVYFSVACLFAQGPETYPRTVPTRIVAASWWFLSLMILVVYTADLTSTFTIDKGDLPIEKIEDLLLIPDIIFGIPKDTSIDETFKNTDYVPFQKMYSRMKETPGESLIAEGSGIEKARENLNFVWITESPYLLYEIGRAPCVTETFTGTNAPKTGGGFGLAFNKANTHWRDLFDVEIVRLHQTGFLAENHRRWFDMRSQCASKSQLASGGTGNIGVDKMEGIFVFFIIGICIAFLTFSSKHMMNKSAKAVPKKWQSKKNSTEESKKEAAVPN